ncbi:hypothetical protein [Parashewanella tropica]|uniref:hypothetical protein n=1 Tax=Parashewanella tropica TaxID=2547970 RepID=UPI001059E0C2|nr:hypothetical protein [Parashewanella tropica]
MSNVAERVERVVGYIQRQQDDKPITTKLNSNGIHYSLQQLAEVKRVYRPHQRLRVFHQSSPCSKVKEHQFGINHPIKERPLSPKKTKEQKEQEKKDTLFKQEAELHIDNYHTPIGKTCLNLLHQAIEHSLPYVFASQLTADILESDRFAIIIPNVPLANLAFPYFNGIEEESLGYSRGWKKDKDVLAKSTSVMSKSPFPRVAMALSAELAMLPNLKFDNPFCAKALQIYVEASWRDPHWIPVAQKIFEQCESPDCLTTALHYKLMIVGLSKGHDLTKNFATEIADALNNTPEEQIHSRVIVLFLEVVKACQAKMKHDPRFIQKLMDVWVNLPEAAKTEQTCSALIDGFAESINCLRQIYLKLKPCQQEQQFALHTQLVTALVINSAGIVKHFSYSEIIKSNYIALIGEAAFYYPEAIEEIGESFRKNTKGRLTLKVERHWATALSKATEKAPEDFHFRLIGVIAHLTRNGDHEDCMTGLKALQYTLPVCPDLAAITKDTIINNKNPNSKFFNLAVSVYTNADRLEDAIWAIDLAVHKKIYQRYPALQSYEPNQKTLRLSFSSFTIFTDREELQIPSRTALGIFNWWVAKDPLNKGKPDIIEIQFGREEYGDTLSTFLSKQLDEHEQVMSVELTKDAHRKLIVRLRWPEPMD